MQNFACVGAAAGKMNLVSAIADTSARLRPALMKIILNPQPFSLPDSPPHPITICNLYGVDGMKPGDKAFVDIQNMLRLMILTLLYVRL